MKVEGPPIRAWQRHGPFAIYLAIIGSMVAVGFVEDSLTVLSPLGRPAALLFALGALAMFPLVPLAAIRLTATTGEAELLDDRIVLEKLEGRIRHEVSLAEVTAYRDHSPWFVEIEPGERRPWHTRPQWTIPTKDEADRTRVLAYLDAAGIRRAA